MGLGSMARVGVFTYLMWNRRNGYIKIGRSKHPEYRERTLQAEDPDIHVIAVIANSNVETSLHQHFDGCRIRGEWFSLTASQVEEVIRTRGFFVPVNGMRFFDEFVGEAFETRLKERLCAEMHHAMSSQAERDWEQIDFTGADSAWR